MSNKEELLSRITVNPKILTGKPVIRGLRISVDHILTALAGGIKSDELLKDYPELEEKDIYAVLLYAAELINEEKVFLMKDN